MCARPVSTEVVVIEGRRRVNLPTTKSRPCNQRAPAAARTTATIRSMPSSSYGHQRIPTAPSVGDDAANSIFDARTRVKGFPHPQGWETVNKRRPGGTRGWCTGGRGPDAGTACPGSHMVIRAPPPGAAPAATRPAVPLDDLLHDRQPQPRAGHRARLRGAVEPLEHVRQVGVARSRPWSSTVSTPFASRTVTVPSAGPHFAALSSRLVTARSTAPASPSTHHGRVATSKSRAARGGGPAPPRGRPPRPGRSLHDVGQRLVAGQLDQVADQGGELLDLGADVVEQLGRLLGRRARRARRPG